MVNMRRNDRKMVRDIRDFRVALAKRGNVLEDEIMFAQVENFQATAREHADATFPLYPEHELRLKYWTQDKRKYNVDGDEHELIIGVPHRIRTVQGDVRQIFFEEVAHDKTALEARLHQDKLNQGGLKKSRNLKDIEHMPKLKDMHRRKLREIKRRAGVI